MPSFITCIGCHEQKRGTEEFRDIPRIENQLTVVNRLRAGANKRQVHLPALEEIAPRKKLCRSCYSKVTYQPVQRPVFDDTPDNSYFRTAPFSHHQCIFKCHRPENLVRVPVSQRFQLLAEYSLVTRENSYWCASHLELETYWPLVKQVSEQLSPEDHRLLSILLSDLFKRRNDNYSAGIFDIDQPDSDHISDKSFKQWIGYSKEQFRQIISYAPSSTPVQMAVFLCKLRHSMSNFLIGSIFGVCASTVANYISSARADLFSNLVPVMLNCHSRSTLASHNTMIARSLFDVSSDDVLIVWDATYRLIQKSANFSAQRKFYSMHKKYPLHKAMVGVTADGFIGYVYGPYPANMNDAVILSDCLERFEREPRILQPGDVFLMDRGFRDVLPELTDDAHGYRAFTPAMATSGALTTEEANSTRFVTKVRYIVEQTFGKLKKKFKFFAQPAHNGALEHDFDSLMVAFSLMNLFHTPVITDVEDSEEIVNLMIARRHTPNLLKELVCGLNLNRQRASFVPLDSSVHEIEQLFPQLTLEQLRRVCLGSYQLRTSISYMQEHVQTHGGVFVVSMFDPPDRSSLPAIDYELYGINVRTPLLIKSKLQSRFKSRVEHFQYILVDQEKEGEDSIVSMYCNCESGARTVGCCSHLMTVVWYLAYAHNHPVSFPNPGMSRLSVTSQ